MQVFKTYFKILKQHTSSMIIYTIIFVVILLLLTANGSSKGGTFKESSVEIAIVDMDETEFSESFISYMKTKQKVTLEQKDKAQMAEDLYYGFYHVILEIPEGAEADLKAGKDISIMQYDTPDSSAQAYVTRQADAFMTAYKAYIDMGYSGEMLKEKVMENMDVETEVKIPGDTVDEADSLHLYYQYMSFILLSVMITSLAPILIAFRKKEVQERSFCSALPKIRQNMGVFLGMAVSSAALLGVLVIISVILYGKNFGINTWVYFLNAFVFMLVSGGIVFLITAFDLSQNAITIIANVVGMGMAFLGGIFVSLEIMSDDVLIISKWLPTYWYVQVLDSLLNTAGALSILDIAKPLGIQLLMAVTFFAVALVLRQIKRERA